MKTFLALIITLTFLGGTSALACTPLPIIEFDTERELAYYYAPKVGSTEPILQKDVSVAVIRTELIRQDKAEYGSHQENMLRHIILETISPSTINIKDRAYVDDPAVQERPQTPSFRTWELGIINKPLTFVGGPTDSCGQIFSHFTLKPDGLYLAFLRKDSDANDYIFSATPIETQEDEIVKAYRKIVHNAPDAPHRMTAESYFKNMDTFIEVNVLECPKSEDFIYTDSRFGRDDKQLNVLYSLGERTREPRYAFDIRDAYLYVVQMNDQSRYTKLENIDCSLGDRFLYLAGHGAKYLKIENGLIDTSKIGTRIEITGPKQIKAVDVKRWIREANPN